MKIQNITDIKGFFKAVCNCTGSVELITSDGDRINLKSTFCQYVALTDMFSESKIKYVEIICSEPKDIKMLLEYIISA
jgi:hypothetical protein